MPDIISQLHKDTELTNGRLLDAVQAGIFVLSIQASKGHCSKPREDLPAPYLYDEFEIAVYGIIPEEISDKFKKWLDVSFQDSTIYGYLPKEELQRLYDMLTTG